MAQCSTVVGPRYGSSLSTANDGKSVAPVDTKPLETGNIAVVTGSNIPAAPTDLPRDTQAAPYSSGLIVSERHEKVVDSPPSLPITTLLYDHRFVEPPPDPLGRFQAPIVIKTCEPSSGHAIEVTGSPTLAPVFLSSYRNEQVPLRQDLTNNTTPAYARSSMSHWFSNPANKIARENIAKGIRSTLAPVRAGKKRPLSDRRSFVPVERTSTSAQCSLQSRPSQMAYSTVIAATPAPPAAVDAIVEGHTPPQYSLRVTRSCKIAVPTSVELIGNSEVDLAFEYDSPIAVKPEPVAYLSYAPIDEDDLLGATVQSSEEQSVVWFDREPVAPIDFDFSDDEGDDEHIDSPIPSTLSRYGDLLINSRTANAETARVASDSDKSSTHVFVLQSPTSPSTSVSSHSSQASDDVAAETILLGNTRARDPMDRLPSGPEDMVSKLELAQAWVLCVTAEHTLQQPISSSIVKLWDFSIIARDADRALELQLQRRAKLGGVSLRDFLKKFMFDRDGMTAASQLIAVFRELAD